jgi:hypothetical protein
MDALIDGAHFIGNALRALESATGLGGGLGEYMCHCSKKCSKHLHSLKTKEEHEKIYVVVLVHGL